MNGGWKARTAGLVVGGLALLGTGCLVEASPSTDGPAPGYGPAVTEAPAPTTPPALPANNRPTTGSDYASVD